MEVGWELDKVGVHTNIQCSTFFVNFRTISPHINISAQTENTPNPTESKGGHNWNSCFTSSVPRYFASLSLEVACHHTQHCEP